MARKSDSYYKNQALIEINTIISYTKNLSFDEFMSNVMIVDATMFRLQQMIEHIKEISGDFKSKHPEIPWVDIVDLGNLIIHEFEKIDHSKVYEAINENIYQLKELFEKSIEPTSNK